MLVSIVPCVKDWELGSARCPCELFMRSPLDDEGESVQPGTRPGEVFERSGWGICREASSDANVCSKSV